MRRILISAVAVASMVLGIGVPAQAAPPPPADAWRMTGNTLTWTAPRRLPIADAAVEFWSGDRLLGRAHSRDFRTYTLVPDSPVKIEELEVRAAGRRLDLPPRARTKSRKAPVALPAALPASPVDPGTPGRFATIEGEYDLPTITVPDMPAPLEMRALVVAPKGASGKRPLALFLHGRHATCYTPGDPEALTIDWPCTDGYQPIPSYRGYRQAQQLLASQGYVTVSISANGVNGQDGWLDDAGAQARSTLIRRHLERWTGWAGGARAAAPEIVRQAPRADLSKVFLMGHSRGGEGVNRAAMDSLQPPPGDGFTGRTTWKIRGLLMIGPTIFGQDPGPDVPSATILPGCDGDVSDLQGQQYIDATRGVSNGKALHSALYVVGANHNFFNTEWTPGQSAAPSNDDWWNEEYDAVCAPEAPTRLTGPQQQTAGATYIAAAARLFVQDDDRVLPLLDGTGVSAPSAGPARVLSHAIGAARTPVIIPGDTLGVTGGRLCDQITEDPEKACTTWSPHFVGFWEVGTEPGRQAVEIAAGTTATLTPRTAAKVGGGELAMRLAVPPNTTGNRFGVTVNGVDLGNVTVDGLPGTEATQSFWAREVRVPLKGVKRITKLELTPRGSATGLLIDAWTRRAGTPDPAPRALPRIDVGTVTDVEGDDGTKTLQVPVKVTGRGTGKVRIFVVDGSTGEDRSFVATIKPGHRMLRVPVEVTGNTRYASDRYDEVRAKAVRGVLVGGYGGRAIIQNDDPAPKITLEPVADTVAEGESLRWRLTLSEAADAGFVFYGSAAAPEGATELSTTDVPAEWLAEVSGEDPQPSRPLSEVYPWIYAEVPAGELTTDITIPTVTDDLAEGEEQIRLDAQVGTWEELLLEKTLIGRVTG
ncbi:hypothetical protein AB0M20_08100 [Actinoplanes sp. NPDC051633]|uniref:hypothetical protein n=1 Tax=Actinoplanes sp. NPDC051633 TaxID=3155670 RepID=UPI003449F95C